MSELHEAVFKWPHPGASDVIVTGSFDQWSGTIHLPRKGSTFEGGVKIPWGEKIAYKYIVDGRWTTTDDQPTEIDPMGNLNNVYDSPVRPPPPTVEVPPAVLASAPEPAAVPEAPEKTREGAVTGAVIGVVETAKQTAVAMVETLAPGTTSRAGDIAPAPLETSPARAVSAEAVHPPTAEPVAIAPTVPIPIVPLGVEPPANGSSTQSPQAASKPLDTTVVEGTATAAPALEASTHAPAVNGAAKPATNGAEKAATNGASKSPPASPNKTMRFPSIGSSRHSSRASVSEFGESSGADKETHASRVNTTQRKKRSSIFGRIKDIFHHEDGSPPK
ncbi:hypothetical protein SCP_0203850 [Sparassis crispa]|uniref:AMP-activated protein kinase glycogen-binding domain-containing protein n=1 Tax=Sparassis crispa TaxID=139825 RepID=A0A401GAI9_9APHY|nr:hypothetical protein SCP_0203850 [Sparassis crispa]GBE79188.1 hypothetical protein SCP_0203850 [Sparassis crispa]